MAVLLALITERKKTVPTWNILQGKTQFSGHLFISGIYNVGYCVMILCDFRNVSSGVRALFFFNRYSKTINLVKEKQNGPQERSFGTPHLVKNTAKSFPPSILQNSHSWHNVQN